MVKILKARPDFLPQINTLVNMYGYADLDSGFINREDIGIVAVHNKKVVGFVWCGIMGRGNMGYVDFYVIHPEYVNQKINERLGRQLIRVLAKKRIKKIIGTVADNKFAIQSIQGARKIGMSVDPVMYAGVRGDVEYMSKVVGV